MQKSNNSYKLLESKFSKKAGVVKLVYTLALGASVFGHGGSSPLSGTILAKHYGSMQINQTFLITADQAGVRLDKFLSTQFPDIPRRIFQLEIKKGTVLVNRASVKVSHKLRSTDEIEIDFGYDTTPLIARPEPQVKFDIIFKHPDFLIVHKPAGISVHPSAPEPIHTLVGGLISHYPTLTEVGENPLRPGIVHRLDKETSGLMIIPLNQKSFLEFKKAFQEKGIQKTYIAICHGKPTFKQLLHRSFIGRSFTNPTKQASVKESSKVSNPKEAITEFELLKTGKNFSLIKAKPKTGRKHQIRVQLLELGHPIVGDKKYYIGNQKSRNLSYPHHLLWANELSFEFKKQLYRFSLETIPD